MVKMPHTPSSERATTRKPETAPPRIADLDRPDQARARRGSSPHVGLDADEHADDARRHRAGGADEERDAGHGRDWYAGERRHVRDIWRLDDVDDDADDDRAGQGQQRDRRVLAPDEGDRALIDGAGDFTHGIRAGVSPQHIASQIAGEADGDQSGNRDQPLKDVASSRFDISSWRAGRRSAATHTLVRIKRRPWAATGDVAAKLWTLK